MLADAGSWAAGGAALAAVAVLAILHRRWRHQLKPYVAEHLQQRPTTSLTSQPVRGDCVICANHPLASAAGVEMFASGGNAVDAAVASLFVLSVVEPMMVSICGGGVAVVRLADGRLAASDSLVSAGAEASSARFAPAAPGVEPTSPLRYKFAERDMMLGARAICTPGSLMGWCRLLSEHGTLPRSAVLRPAIQHAEHGFPVSRYLHKFLCHHAEDLQTTCPEAAAIFLANGKPTAIGALLRQPQLAATLRRVVAHGADELHSRDGILAQSVASIPEIAVSLDDLCAYRVREPPPVRGWYRGWQVVGPPLGASGAFVVALLQVLERFDVRRRGAGTADAIDLLAQALTLVSAERAIMASDPEFTQAAAEPLLTEMHARQLASRIAVPRRAGQRARGTPGADGFEDGSHTTHVTAADRAGNVVAITQTLNDHFGACLVAPACGALLNSGMTLFDPRPGLPNSVAAGKRPASSHAPTLLLHPSGRVHLTLGKIGGMRIWPSVAQVIVNIVDHGMSVQAALDAPLMWTRGGVLELERAHGHKVTAELAARGYQIKRRDAIGGGASAIMAQPQVAAGCDGLPVPLEGACCWRADGHAAALAGCEARDVEPHF